MTEIDFAFAGTSGHLCKPPNKALVTFRPDLYYPRL